MVLSTKVVLQIWWYLVEVASKTEKGLGTPALLDAPRLQEEEEGLRKGRELHLVCGWLLEEVDTIPRIWEMNGDLRFVL